MAQPPPRPPVRRLTLIGNHPVTTSESMLGLYEPLEVIGSGSFGIIRTVKRKTDGAILARKELNWRKMDERDLKQLNEEVNILQNMPPNEYIVQYHERFLDKTNCTLHIIMEYCENGDLTHVIQRCRQDHLLLPEEVIWSYLTQITLALADCHADTDSQGRKKTVVLHRDLKPENVFLSKDNILKLGDFGLSKAMSANFTNTYVGTPYYMSPELINGQQYDMKSDIWALGCLIFELCAWHPPFSQAQTQPELAKLIRDGKIPSLPQGYSVMLNQVVKSMLRQDPKQRPTTKQIMTLDQVKLQIKALDLRRFKNTLVRERDNIVKERETLAARERLLAEREQAIAEREGAVLEQEHSLMDREAALAEREEALTIRQESLAERQDVVDDLSQRELVLSERERMVEVKDRELESWRLERERVAMAFGLNLNPDLHRTGYMERSSLQNSLREDDENRMPSMSSIGLALPSSEKEDVIRRIASRPSLVPRLPLEERRSITQISRRISTNSLMSLDETPIKSPVYGTRSNAPASSENRRRMTSSKSMYNLNSQQKAPTARQLFHSSSKDSLVSTALEIGSQRSPRHGTFYPPRSLSSDGSPPMLDAIPSSAPSSPSKRSAQMAFSQRSSIFDGRVSSAPPSVVSMPLPSPVERPIPPRTSTAPPVITSAPAKYNMDDEDNLPSPFIKKKSSLLSLGGASIINKSASRTQVTPSTRTLRPSTSRQSLNPARIALSRNLRSNSSNSLLDEQGRMIGGERRNSATTLAT